jgi:Cof subfamily protein (haloacid dehalogenase superfamily)
MKFSVVCTDIDGTLLDANRQLSSRTISAFRRLPPDVLVILASSRMPAAMRHLQAELGVLKHPLICYNGGYVIEHDETGNVAEIDSVVIPHAVCRSIIDLTNNTSVHVSFYHKDEWFAPAWDYWTDREARITKVTPAILSAAEVLNKWENKGGAHKLMCMGDEHEIHELQGALETHFGNDIHVYRSRPTYLELAPKAVSKGSALAQLLARRNAIHISSSIAFGDNYNDIELLRMAGHGVAVGNAREEVKAVANEVAADSKADGVAMVLEKYLDYDAR